MDLYRPYNRWRCGDVGMFYYFQSRVPKPNEWVEIQGGVHAWLNHATHCKRRCRNLMDCAAFRKWDMKRAHMVPVEPVAWFLHLSNCDECARWIWPTNVPNTEVPGFHAEELWVLQRARFGVRPWNGWGERWLNAIFRFKPKPDDLRGGLKTTL